MRILNVCDERIAELELRKRAISSRIALQRAELEQGLQCLRRPFRAFDAARSGGAWLREHWPAIAMALAPVLFVLRGPLGSGVGLAARMVRKGTRWWALWKTGSKLFSMVPAFSRRKGYAR